MRTLSNPGYLLKKIGISKISFYLFIFLLSVTAKSQVIIRGNVIDDKTKQPLEGITVTLLPSHISTLTDARGYFTVKQYGETNHSIEFSSVGYELKTLYLDELKHSNNTIALTRQTVELQSVSVSRHAGEQYRAISKIDIAMHGVTNSQEVLRIVPGLFIGQHQGGGLAEQIFLRGFDCDHGTDIALFADGIPINLVSHAHGQGYADSHFIIPETIAEANFKKGPYYAEKGDFCTTGFVDFNTRNALTTNVIKLEGGMFNTYRVLGMFNLLSEQAKAKQQSWYVASEYMYTNGYFDNPEHFKRFNFFTKYNGKISQGSSISLTASMLWSKWSASGQIPERAVAEGLIGFYGALDPNEGGVTTRTNFNAQLLTTLKNGDLVKNQLYYSNYTFDLHSNFTFFLVDSVNGDELRLKESRNLVGYKGSYNHINNFGNCKLTTEAGVQVRLDAIRNSELSNTINRFTIIKPIKLGNITEVDAAAYVNETFNFNEHFSVNAGLRFDQFHNKYNNKLAGDSTLPGPGVYKANANILSPKINFYYHPNDKAEFYLTTGRNFHSNDARAAILVDRQDVLPKAYGADLGTVFKPTKKILINAAIWYLYLTQEFVYGEDGGSIEFNGKTRRLGFDFSGRYQPMSSLYFDVDVNYAHGRAVGLAKGRNYIPLAPVWSTTGGITYINKAGLNGGVHYRYLANRAANEDYSLTAKGYFIADLVVNYTKPKYEVGLTVNNIFNTRWKETQFATETRLRGEAQPVDEICFTAGTPLAAMLSLTVFFK